MKSEKNQTENANEAIRALIVTGAKIIFTAILAPALLLWLGWVSSAAIEAIERISKAESRIEENSNNFKYIRTRLDEIHKELKNKP